MKKAYFISSIVLVSVITLLCFSLFYLFGKDKLLGQAQALGQVDTSVPNPGIQTYNEEGEAAEITAQIEKYESLLASKYLVLVNADNTLLDDSEQGYDIVAVSGFSNIKLEKEASDKLIEFLAAANADGIDCTVIRGYVSAEKQQELYDEEYAKNVAAGYTDESVIIAKTKRAVALPEYSEYRLGLAVDIGQTSNTVSASEAEKTSFYAYANANIYKYGFILRYPKDKESVTGFDFNPWHFRYIGDAEQAKYITEKNISLEEYTEYLNTQLSILRQKLAELGSSAS